MIRKDGYYKVLFFHISYIILEKKKFKIIGQITNIHFVKSSSVQQLLTVLTPLPHRSTSKYIKCTKKLCISSVNMNVYFHFVVRLTMMCNKLTIINECDGSGSFNFINVHITHNLISSKE